ncbi:hypothetical protein [Aestuariivirga litoralis]|uniref:hypothetical protein n=1 Tax=Aestuariivirga litoralis TaxID=2650924 RepID=UPI0018C79827|nr:hypothetical protein [Aestuariivirga litoralis]MBG1233013.1 hypothetical protein [Aestuariivirga litoralis]
MRILFGLSLVLGATALSGCVSDTYQNLTSGSLGCTTSSVSVNCGSTSTTNNPTTPTTTTTTGTGTTTATTQNTGNNTNFTTGDTTLILEGSIVKSIVGAKPGLSRLLDSPLNHLTANQTANTKIQFNTNTSTNSAWPVAKTMAYSEYGTCELDGGVDTSNPGKCVNGTGGTGLQGDYKLYRAYQKNVYDEELQLWTWNDSYATQYRDVTASGTDPQHQAWSFGGNYTPTASMPTSGTVNYTGKFTATAKSANFVDVPHTTQWDPNQLSISNGKTMSRDNDWRVLGDSALTANFGSGAFSGTLTPKFWEARNESQALETIDVDQALANSATGDCYFGVNACDPNTLTGAANYSNWQNHAGFMDSTVKLAGTITTSTTDTLKPNQITGTATLDSTDGWITSDTTNPMYGGFFGAGAKEVTGAFAVDATYPEPSDGKKAINDDRRGYLSMSGIFHGTAP